MQKSYLMVRDSDSVILGLLWNDDDNAGPVPPQQVAPEGVTLVFTEEVFDRAGHSDTCVATWASGSIVWTDTATLEDLKSAKNLEINTARHVANQSYFEFSSKQIACDAVSMLDIQSANAEIALTREMPSTWPGAWKAIDNSYALIPDVATWTLFIKAMVSRGTAHFAHAQALKQLLATAMTPEAVAEISWGMELGD